PTQLAELRMYGLSWAIRSKPEWQRKICDPEIIEKWRKEALEQQESIDLAEKMTHNMVNYVLTELSGYARLSVVESGIECGPFDAIWYSDRLISNETSKLLRVAVARPVTDIPDESKDWHPGSNGQVLDLVHPSLYPIIYGRTLAGSNLQPPQLGDSEHYANYALSSRFCWLPSDFSVDATDGLAKLVSPYINNLHPTTHKPLYRIIESVLSAFIPVFERVLSQINGQDQDLYRDVPPGSGRIKVERTKLLDEAPKTFPEAHEEYTGELEKMIVPYSLKGKTIQCIIKLANIRLTPENPEYKGGSWHVEGMFNERIVASGIYYYEEDNISESRLAFRVTTGPPVYHEQDDELCMDILYGMKRHATPGQITSAGRALAWPNIYQHRVAPFSLVDRTKPGHRKILALFLVDPSIAPIPSATTVPPQQADWAFAAMEDARADPGSLFSRLPPELSNAIRERLPDAFVARAEAEEYRLRLMKERTRLVEVHDRKLSHSFNMCEH
ncbi:hypothetical protein B0H17DRAFT_920489, partial [Mycena rosella]